MSETEMVERVAKAIHALVVDRSRDVSSVDLARAAIGAMRQPTEAMVHGAWFEPVMNGRHAVGYAAAYKVWRAMIDAALGEAA